MTKSTRRAGMRTWNILVATALASLLGACGGGGSGTTLSGSATVAGQALKQAQVTVYEDPIATTQGSNATSGQSEAIATTTTSSSGSWSVPFTCQPQTAYYVVVSGGMASTQTANNSVLALMSVIPSCDASQGSVTVNESTTLVSALSLRNLLQFSGPGNALVAIEPAPTVPGALYEYSSLIGSGGALTSKLTGDASAYAEFQLLSSALNACATDGASSKTCSDLLAVGAQLSGPDAGKPATNTLQAVDNVLSNALYTGSGTGGSGTGGSGTGGSGTGTGACTGSQCLSGAASGDLSQIDSAINTLATDLGAINASLPSLTSGQASALGNLISQLQGQLNQLQTVLSQLGSGAVTGNQLMTDLDTILANLKGIQNNLAALIAQNPAMASLQPVANDLAALNTQLGNLISQLNADGQATNNSSVSASLGNLLTDLQSLLGQLQTLQNSLTNQVASGGTSGSGSTTQTCSASGVVNGVVNGLICGLNGLTSGLSSGNLLSGLGALLGL